MDSWFPRSPVAIPLPRLAGRDTLKAAPQGSAAPLWVNHLPLGRLGQSARLEVIFPRADMVIGADVIFTVVG